jgi:hypothetical protein
MKVNRANAQSRLAGFCYRKGNSKLCFALLTSFSAAQNHLPRSLAAGGKTRSEVDVSVKKSRCGTGSLLPRNGALFMTSLVVRVVCWSRQFGMEEFSQLPTFRSLYTAAKGGFGFASNLVQSVSHCHTLWVLNVGTF